MEETDLEGFGFPRNDNNDDFKKAHEQRSDRKKKTGDRADWNLSKTKLIITNRDTQFMIIIRY